MSFTKNLTKTFYPSNVYMIVTKNRHIEGDATSAESALVLVYKNLHSYRYITYLVLDLNNES